MLEVDSEGGECRQLRIVHMKGDVTVDYFARESNSLPT